MKSTFHKKRRPVTKKKNTQLDWVDLDIKSRRDLEDEYDEDDDLDDEYDDEDDDLDDEYDDEDDDLDDEYDDEDDDLDDEYDDEDDDLDDEYDDEDDDLDDEYDDEDDEDSEDAYDPYEDDYARVRREGRSAVAAVGRAPKKAEVPKRVQAPKKAEAPKRAQAPKKAEAPKRAQAPKKAEPPKRVQAPKKAEPSKRAQAPKKAEAPKRVQAPPKVPREKMLAKGNPFRAIGEWLSERSASDHIIILTGVAVVGLVMITLSLYGGAKKAERQIATFVEVGQGMENIPVIGQAGLLNLADYSRTNFSNASEFEEDWLIEEEVAEENSQNADEIRINMNAMSIQKDMKIKFVSSATSKLVSGISFEVRIKNDSGGELTKKDDDKDGVIYLTGMKSGKYTITLLSPTTNDKYKLPMEAVTVIVKENIEYAKVDVADEIKTEAQVNAAVEDTAVNNTTVESTNQDTVEWVESTKTIISGTEVTTEDFKEVELNHIEDPAKSSSLMLSPSMIALVMEQEADHTPIIGMQMKLSVSAAVKILDRYLLLGFGEAGGNELPVPSDDSSKDPEEGGGTSESPSNGEVVPSKEPETSPSGGPTPTPQGTAEPTATPTQIPTPTKEAEPTAGIATQTPSATPSATPASSPSASPSVSPSAVASVSPSPTASPTPTPKGMGDTTSVLKTTDGKTVYIKNEKGKFVEAKFADYYKYKKFYVKSTKTEGEYIYTGWQTIDGKTYFFDKTGKKVTGEQVILGAKYVFDENGCLNNSSGILGIDVSKWNGNIDWNAVKNSGVSYAIIRCGYRGSTTGALIEDPMFRTNINGAKKAGIKVGVYFFTQATNEVEAVEEASMVLSLLSGHSLNYPVFLDVEGSNGRGDAIDAGTRTAVIRAFCQTIQNSGYKAGVYANKTWYESKMDVNALTGYKIWLAQYAATPTYGKTRYDMWQYSSKGSIAGISGNVDMNLSYLNY